MHKIHFPQEVDVWYILPAIRKKIALGLLKSGLSQKDIAVLMKTSEATISHYKKEKRVKEDVLGSSIDIQIKKSVNKIIQNNSLLFSEILKLSNIVKENGLFCKIYHDKTTMDTSTKPCNDCMQDTVRLCIQN
ncbi:MAG: hypothetical protein HN601_13170 [Candidatus Marinimicrobia bacterium]|jgi:predicted transcriptional regulator|nr:hypothetical protein [Candidatus Neomarinimicrobiota bacterium]